ncbi:efflux RND transporter permease subunit [Dokdonella sp.]|uniref:efflux RND transporter permease subunit n=1 Tax=Dokdonella sp. TaxID=2291710 RepID=UPI001B1780A4|nr:efflux RND transporter permease subunit [Dokdonella sp.]MBO9662598.1 efflux RND transporter permease subunit [Dokdonella sp.]
MKIIEASLKNPIAVAMAVLLVCLLGLMSLRELPLQLFPDIDRPQISIQTNWRAASPEEVEAELLEPQEQVLQGVPGLEELDGNASAGGSNVNLTFAIGTDMKNALVEVIGRLNRVRSIPKDADRPIVQMGGNNGGANQTLSWFFVQLLPGTAGKIEDYRRLIENTVKPRIEAVPGVAQVVVYAGPPNEVRITVDMAKAASLGVSMADIATRAAAATDVSGGQVDIGRQQFQLRYTGRYKPEQLGALVLSSNADKTVHLGDVATIEVRPPRRQAYAYQNGNPAIGLQIDKVSGANVLQTLNAVKQVVAELRDGPLKAKGLGIEQSFDSSLFINRAIHLLTENLIVGALLSLLCVWWFMRDARATVLIAAAIPVCLLATFTVLQLSGHTLNVISLAGLAFAVGMVVEGAIVVSGNILRLKESGMTPYEATLVGTQQVVGALIASTITTIAVFLPVMFLRDVEGQIFSDLALTISIAVAISVVVAITALPASAGWLKAKKLKSGYGDGWPWLTDKIMAWTDTRPRQIGWVLALLVLPLVASYVFMPRLDYLPPVKRAAIDSIVNFPPGMPPEVIDREIIPTILERMKPYMAGTKQPQLKNWFVNVFPGGGGSVGARVVDESRIGELERIMREEIMVGFPDTRVFTLEGNLFGGFGGSARAVSIHLQGEDAAKLYQVADAGRRLLEAKFPGAIVQAFPPTDAAQLELHAVPDDRRIAEAGWDRVALGEIVRALGDGAWLGEYFNGEERVPVILRASAGQTPEELAQTPIVAPNGKVVTVGEMVRLETSLGPAQIRRLDHRRTVTLTMDPPPTLALETALAMIDKDIVPTLRSQFPDGTIRLAGSADRLDRIVGTIGKNFLLALFVLGLLMAAMFKSLRYALIVVLTVPLALIGGMLGLRVLGLFSFQPLDLLSMIGFIMMVGVVVNHAILLVDLTRHAQMSGAPLAEAIRMSLNQRLRAILASTLTGALGALPMAINPGPGSVIYRGLAAVNVGGVVVSLVFSLLLLPSLIRLFFPGESRSVALAPPHHERPRLVEVEAA